MREKDKERKKESKRVYIDVEKEMSIGGREKKFQREDKNYS